MRDLLFVVGCPRSGTTWMQLLLAEHPEVATANETFLFYRYLQPLWREWRAERNRYTRPLGLGAVLTEERFVDLCREFARGALSEIATPESSVIVEKTPGHVTCARLILDCFPRARFLHVVRDPRDVACSLMAAEASWAEGWAPGHAHDAAHMWHDLVAEGRRIAKMTGNYREVRYEDLQENAAEELAGVLAWLNLEYSPESCRDAVRATSIEEMSERRGEAGAVPDRRPWDTDREPEGFFRKGRSGNWREELSRRQVHTVEYVTQGLMSDLGYATTSRLLRLPPLAEIRRRLARSIRRRSEGG